MELLERAMAYTFGCLALVRLELLHRPTPCSAWDLQALLQHMDASLLTLHDAALHGRVDLEEASASVDGMAVVASLQSRGAAMVGAWVRPATIGPLLVEDLPLPPEVVAVAGALEVAVHGWDVARACGQPGALPDSLADDLLDAAWLLVDEAADRPGRFGRQHPVRPWVTPGARLLGFLGRHPG